MNVLTIGEPLARFWCKACGKHFGADALLIVNGAYCPYCGSGKTSPHVSKYMSVDVSSLDEPQSQEHTISALLRVIKGE